jgi:hypothetical protein
VDRRLRSASDASSVVVVHVRATRDGRRRSHGLFLVALAQIPCSPPPPSPLGARASPVLRAARGVHQHGLERELILREMGAVEVGAWSDAGRGRRGGGETRCPFWGPARTRSVVPSEARDAARIDRGTERSAGLRGARAVATHRALHLVLPPVLVRLRGLVPVFLPARIGAGGGERQRRARPLGLAVLGTRARGRMDSRRWRTRTLPRTSPASGPCATRTRPVASRDPPYCSRGRA